MYGLSVARVITTFLRTHGLWSRSPFLRLNTSSKLTGRLCRMLLYIQSLGTNSLSSSLGRISATLLHFVAKISNQYALDGCTGGWSQSQSAILSQLSEPSTSCVLFSAILLNVSQAILSSGHNSIIRFKQISNSLIRNYIFVMGTSA